MRPQIVLINLFYHFKTSLPFLYSRLEQVNDFFFSFFFYDALKQSFDKQIKEINSKGKISFNFLTTEHVDELSLLLNSLEPDLKKYFEVHEYCVDAIRKLTKLKSFFMLGAFDGTKLIGYFFLRVGINKVCFIGRMVQHEYRNKGIGYNMLKILLYAAWELDFKVYSTVSVNNKLVMKSHLRNKNIRFMRRLKDDYWLLEFVRY